MRFAGCAVVAGPVVGALLGATVKVLDGAVSFGTDVLTWWAGDALAVLVVAAPVVFFVDRHRARLPEPRRGEMFALWCAAGEGIQSLLVEADPERFFVPPYVGHRGWLGVRLDRGVDWDEIAGIAEDAFAEIAPARLVAAAARQGES